MLWTLQYSSYPLIVLRSSFFSSSILSSHTPPSFPLIFLCSFLSSSSILPSSPRPYFPLILLRSFISSSSIISSNLPVQLPLIVLHSSLFSSSILSFRPPPTFPLIFLCSYSLSFFMSCKYEDEGRSDTLLTLYNPAPNNEPSRLTPSPSLIHPSPLPHDYTTPAVRAASWSTLRGHLNYRTGAINQTVTF